MVETYYVNRQHIITSVPQHFSLEHHTTTGLINFEVNKFSEVDGAMVVILWCVASEIKALCL